MTVAIDTNIIVAFLNTDDALNRLALAAIERVSIRGRLVICAPVAAELMASPGQSSQHISRILSDLLIEIDWNYDELLWRSAGNAFAAYAKRRRKARSAHPRRILADFLIGAHAFEKDYPLLTLDDRSFRAAFPQLRIVSA